MSTNQQFRRMLHSNLSVEVYRVKNATIRLGITHREGTIFLDDDNKNLYLAKENTFPFHTLNILLADNKLIRIGGDKTANDTMFKSVYDTNDSGIVDASESLTTSTGTITGDEILALIVAGGDKIEKGIETLVMDTPKAVTYATTFASTNYSLVINCYDASGYMVGFTKTLKAATGFTVEAAANCTMEYIAIAL